MKTMYLVDASNMFYRAYFAIPPLTNDKGMPTNALYGFFSMSMRLIRDVKPDYLVYCFDRKEPSFRADLYEGYKANRDEMPDDLQPQIPYLKQMTELLGVAQVEKERFEADDVIGTLATLGAKNGLDVVIVSGDKDFAQLVQPGISIYDTMKDVRMDVDGVKAKFGVRPDQIIDYLAIVGDTSDNIPGVRGVGPKGAQKLLHDFDSLGGIYENIEKIKGATKTKLEDGKASAILAQKLVTIVRDVPIETPIEELKLKSIDIEPLRGFLREMGFSSFERKFLSANDSTPPAKSAAKVKVEEPVKKILSKRSLTKIAKWNEEEWTVEDLRTKIDPYSEIWGLLSERGLYLGWQGKVLKVPASDREIGEALDRKHLHWKGFDVKPILKALNLRNAIVDWDSLLAAYVVRANQIGDFASVYLEYCQKTLPDICTPVDQMLAHLELEAVLREEIIERDGTSIYETLDLPMVNILAAMESRGLLINQEELKAQSVSLTEDIKILEAKIHKAAGETFNIGSPKQLGNILFEKMKLPSAKKTKTGYSTDSEVLQGLESEHEIAGFILSYRELTKLKSTYVDAIPALVNPDDGRIHTSLNQAATSTGRLSSTNPNLQNIPIRTERGRLVRKAFIASPGNCLVSADYSQIELRILAHITSDPGLTKAFLADLDIHTATASEVFGIELDSVTPDQRRVAKAVNFGIAYGQGAFGLSETLGISRADATEVIARYFTRFSGVKQYMEDTIRDGMENGYVSTIFGRRRYFDELKSDRAMIRKAGERAAINAPIQGTASDLMKLAMIEVHRSSPMPMLLQVHDELLFECPKDYAVEFGQDIKAIMESVYKLSIPLKVNIGIGDNWDDAH